MTLLRTEVRGEEWKRMVRVGAEVLMSAEGGAWECAAPAALEAQLLAIILFTVADRSTRSSLRFLAEPARSAW